MKTINPTFVEQQYIDWQSAYTSNINRAEKSILFAQGFEQWDDGVASNRLQDNKESLTFNTCLKHSKKIKSQIREIEFTLNLAATNSQYTTPEINNFRLLLNHFTLSKDVIDRCSEAFDKCVDYGFSFVEVNFEQDGFDTLCNSPVVRMHNDPSIAFWDMKATHPTKTDGKFCGMQRTVSKDDFLNKYPQYDKDNSDIQLVEKDNKVIDYWYKEYKEMTYIALKGGIYKREDLLKPTDEKETIQELAKRNLPPEKKANVPQIYYMRICNGAIIQKPTLFPTDCLPLVYHAGLTTWTTTEWRTYPFTYALEDAQKALNFVHSQLITSVKNTNSDKWLMTEAMLPTPELKERAKEINNLSGVVMIGVDPNAPQGPRREQASDIPFALMEYSQSLAQQIDNISGAFVDMQQSDSTVVSGKALKQMTENVNIIQVGLISHQIIFVNKVCDLIKQMVPKICTEQRTLLTQAQDGQSQSIIINQLLPTGTIQNDIKNISNDFVYTITAGPSSQMQKENTFKALQMVYAIRPDQYDKTGDIFMRSLDTPDAQELEIRVRAGIDPMLVQYSQGAISQQQYQQYTQQQAQQGQQMQMQQMQMQMQESQARLAKLENESQAIQLKSQTEQAKVQAISQDLNIKGQVAIANAANAQANTQINAQKVMGEQQQTATQQALDENHLQYEREKQAELNANTVIGHALDLHKHNQTMAQAATNTAMMNQSNQADNDANQSAN